MKLQPHQERVIQEKKELDEKIEKLATFIGISEDYQKLETSEQGLLLQQGFAMRQYSDILKARIKHFAFVR